MTVASLPAAVTGDPSEMPPWLLPFVAAVAVAFRGAGFFPDIAGYVAIGSIALVLVVELELYTGVELSRRFAVVFATMTTMALQALWIVAQFYSGGSTRRSSGPRPSSSGTSSTSPPWGSYSVSSRSGTWTGSNPSGRSNGPRRGDLGMGLTNRLELSGATERRLVRGLQLGLVAIVGYGPIGGGGVGVAAPAAVALGITLLPALLRREYGYAMDSGLVLWITVAAFLHTVGSLGLYARYQW